MSEPTDQDRETALALWNEILRNGDIPRWTPTGAIAAALAAEREKAREPFLALADSIQGPPPGDRESDWEAGNKDAMNRIAAHIRRAAEATP